MATYRETSLGQVTGKLTTQITLPVTYPTLITLYSAGAMVQAMGGWP